MSAGRSREATTGDGYFFPQDLPYLCSFKPFRSLASRLTKDADAGVDWHKIYGPQLLFLKSVVFTALAFAHLPSQGVPQDMFIPLARD